MKQLVAQLIVFAVIAAVVAFFVWVIRGRRASLASGRAALEALASELGTTYTASSQPRLEGTFTGRHCTLQQLHRPGSDDDRPFVHITVACNSKSTFQLYRSKAGLAGIEAPDLVRTGDAEFDVQLELRAGDADRARTVLTEDRRRRLLDWFRHGWVDTVWQKDGRLLIDGGFGFREQVEVERARLLLQAGVEIAGGLER